MNELAAIAALLIFALCGVLPIVGHVLATRRIAMRNDRRRSSGQWITAAALADWKGLALALALFGLLLMVAP